jgi:hypothetical protein
MEPLFLFRTVFFSGLIANKDAIRMGQFGLEIFRGMNKI